MDIGTPLALILLVGLVIAVLIKLAAVGVRLGSAYQPERRHDDWGPEARRPRSDWSAGPRIR